MRKALVRMTAGIAIAITAVAARAPDDYPRYDGMCDASAVVSLGDDRFVVANDEDNVLRIYRIGQSAPLSVDQDLSEFLAAGSREADIEGAARIGSRIYWVTSHGANKDGEERLERRRFFATDIVVSGQDIRLVPAGKPYLELVADLTRLDTANRFDFPRLANTAPEKGGLNIEGLVARPDGTLLLALRSPVVKGRATLVPIVNPARMIAGETAQLGAPIALSLGKLGVRSIEASPGGGYVVSAGPVAKGGFKLFSWDGVSLSGQPLPIALGKTSPEAIAIMEGAPSRLLLLSDDGDELVGGKECKKSPSKSFRGFEVEIPGK